MQFGGERAGERQFDTPVVDHAALHKTPAFVESEEGLLDVKDARHRGQRADACAQAGVLLARLDRWRRFVAVERDCRGARALLKAGDVAAVDGQPGPELQRRAGVVQPGIRGRLQRASAGIVQAPLVVRFLRPEIELPDALPAQVVAQAPGHLLDLFPAALAKRGRRPGHERRGIDAPLPEFDFGATAEAPLAQPAARIQGHAMTAFAGAEYPRQARFE